MRTYDQLKVSLSNKGYEFFEGEMNLNFIWERTSDDITNHFTDFLHIVYQSNGENIVLSLPATTKPGLKGSIDRVDQPTVDGETGTAVIIPGQYKGSHKYTINTGASAFEKAIHYNYFRQIEGVNYWRDGNRDLVVDHVQEQDNEVFGTHWHSMSNPGTCGSGEVNNWSEGCQGLCSLDWIKVLPITEESIKTYGDIFTLTLIESRDIDG